MEAFYKYRKIFCNERGEQESNLSKSEQRGLVKLRKRIKDGGILAIKTDKSGNLTIIDKEKYLEMGLKNSEGDIEITRRDLRRIEGRINAQ